MSIPTGSIFLYSGTIPPRGYILCNGQNITAFPVLVAVLNSNIAPNLVNLFPVQTTPGIIGGRFFINNYTLPSHTHSCANFAVANHNHNWNVNTYTGHTNRATSSPAGRGAANCANVNNSFVDFANIQVPLNGAMANFNNPNPVQPIDIRNRFLVLNYIIKT
jgi:microcystin-dependent protein